MYGKKNLDGILLITLKYKAPIYAGGLGLKKSTKENNKQDILMNSFTKT